MTKGKIMLNVTVLVLLCIFCIDVKSVKCYASQVQIESVDEKTADITNEMTDTKITDIELSGLQDTLEVGKSITLTANIVPIDMAGETVIYETSTPEIISVKQSGEITGLAVGEAVVVVKAGEFSKELRITVKVGTTAIKLNTTYLVLKKNETYDLKADIFPIEADQNVSFKSYDTSVATVSANGKVTAKEIGDTVIEVSNSDMSSIVTVIVNENSSKVVQTSVQPNLLENTSEKYNLLVSQLTNSDVVEINAEEYKVLDTEILKYIYDNDKVISVNGAGYKLKIVGEDIINFNNTLNTELDLQINSDEMNFVLNGGKNLPGTISVILDNSKEYKILYLYNDSTQKYENLNNTEISEMKLNTTGKYKLTKADLQYRNYFVIRIAVVGCVAVIIAVVVYLLIKKQYWFW